MRHFHIQCHVTSKIHAYCASLRLNGIGDRRVQYVEHPRQAQKSFLLLNSQNTTVNERCGEAGC